jgi:uracil phosphoribosyltransferase
VFGFPLALVPVSVRVFLCPENLKPPAAGVGMTGHAELNQAEGELPMLHPVAQTSQCAVYRISDHTPSGINRLVVSTPETRAIANDPRVMGVDYTRRLKNTCARILETLKAQEMICLEEHETIVFDILRGGLNFGLREALADAFSWNRHGGSFISAQRARIDDNPEQWHIMESEYSKVYMPKTASIVIGDVVATGTSLEHAMKALVTEAEKQGTALRSIVFFTFGGQRAEEILNAVDTMCRDRFPSYEGTTLIYLEGRFIVPTEETALSIKVTGTDLLRTGALMAPEFVESHYENPSYPIQRCAIYDAGSRAFWTPEYIADLTEYWGETLSLAEKGMSFEALLKERFPELDAARFGEVDLAEICRKQISQLEPQ